MVWTAELVPSMLMGLVAHLRKFGPVKMVAQCTVFAETVGEQSEVSLQIHWPSSTGSLLILALLQEAYKLWEPHELASMPQLCLVFVASHFRATTSIFEFRTDLPKAHKPVRKWMVELQLVVVDFLSDGSGEL